MNTIRPARSLLDRLNAEYFKLHKVYEELFWTSYMGDYSVDTRMNKAQTAIDSFRSNAAYAAEVERSIGSASAKDAERLAQWKRYFDRYQAPPELSELKERITRLESIMLENRSKRQEGYIDPHTKKFVETSSLKMRTMVSTHEDEKIRKACFEAAQKLATGQMAEYLEVVRLRNEYAVALGYDDFYAFKVELEDGMTKQELFGLFDTIYEKTKGSFATIRELEKSKPGLRKPWNFNYYMAGNFTKEEDPYFDFGDALMRWGKSFMALGIQYRGGALQLDLIDRKGKWNNGFCHWPTLVRYEDGALHPGASNFTCNVVPGQVGSGVAGYNTLFHEGGHAAHLLNAEEREIVLNAEYSPMSMAWAETQSMFLDTMFSSIEWKMRYAKDANGNSYPFDLYERKVRKLHPLKPMRINSIMFVSSFEREVYETKNLTAEKVIAIAKRAYKKYYDQSEDSLWALNVPHIYSWESSGSYHGYALAELALSQWREYFYTKYGYIVDNPRVGKEMRAVWKLGARYTFKEFVVRATGKKLSAAALLKNITRSVPTTLRDAKEKIAKLDSVAMNNRPVQLGASIRMVHGKKLVADNTKSFEDMAKKYQRWLTCQIQ